MDWSKTPESMLPEHLYAAVSFDAVNRVFRDSKVFNSHIYDSTIGLFIGPTILAMEGKKHWEHRNLVSAAFKSRSLSAMGAGDRPARRQRADRRVHRRRQRRSGQRNSLSSSPPG